MGGVGETGSGGLLAGMGTGGQVMPAMGERDARRMGGFAYGFRVGSIIGKKNAASSPSGVADVPCGGVVVFFFPIAIGLFFGQSYRLSNRVPATPPRLWFRGVRLVVKRGFGGEMLYT